MKKLFSVALATFFLCTVYSAEDSFLCPKLVEILPDPVDTVDAAGEFVEIRLVESLHAPLTLRMESKPEMVFENVTGRRLLLHRDTLACPKDSSVDCRALTADAIPNSREMYWILAQGSCIDSVSLPSPKPGKSLQWNDRALEWDYAQPTPGSPNPKYELGINDCGISVAGTLFKNGSFEVGILLDGCDSSLVYYSSETLDFSGRKIFDSVFVNATGVLKIPSVGVPERFLAFVPPDEISFNDSIEILLVSVTRPPLLFTEVHFCPEEGESEWVELYNTMPRALSLNRFSFCGRGSFFAEGDSILPYESILLAKDSASLRHEIGFAEAKIIKTNFGALKNAGDTLALCYMSDTLTVVTWGKEMQHVCPAGFNPQNGTRENTPGFQGRVVNSQKVPFSVDVSSRSLSISARESIHYRIRGNASSVRVVLLNEKGRTLKELSVVPNENTWLEIPLDSVSYGVYFLKCILGRYEKTIGIVVRP